MKALMRLLLATLVCTPAFSASAHGLRSLDDSELSDISGGEGVIVGLEIYYNAQKNAGNPALDGSGLGNTVTDANAVPDGNCVGSNNPCRVAWQLAGREARSLSNTAIGGSGSTAAQGEWLVFKDSYLALKMPSLYLDGGTLGGALSAATAYEGFLDPSRFQSTSGGCPITGSTSACDGPTTLSTLKLTPALVMRQEYRDLASCPSNEPTCVIKNTGYDSGTKTSSNYDSMGLSLRIGRLGVEYDTGPCTYAGGAACGYNQDLKGSYVGIAIRDNNSPFAGVAVGGRMYLYGF